MDKIKETYNGKAFREVVSSFKFFVIFNKKTNEYCTGGDERFSGSSWVKDAKLFFHISLAEEELRKFCLNGHNGKIEDDDLIILEYAAELENIVNVQ